MEYIKINNQQLNSEDEEISDVEILKSPHLQRTTSDVFHEIPIMDLEQASITVKGAVSVMAIMTILMYMYCGFSVSCMGSVLGPEL